MTTISPVSSNVGADCLSVALEYIRGGIDVTPITSPRCGKKDAGKQPTLVGWQKARLTAEAFEVEYLRKKGQNIGVVTGEHSGIICVDLDGPEGAAWFLEHELKLGNFITERRGASTHLYYQHPGNGIYVPSKIRLFPGVDIFADGGKQVVTWPSVHRSGDRYTIDNGLTLIDVKDESDVLPQWILDELASYEALRRAKANTNLNADVSSQEVFSTNEADIQQCIEALLALPPGIKGQGRDHKTYVAAATCADFGMSKSMAIDLLMEHYNPRCQPPKTPEDVKEKVEHAYKYHKEPVGHKTIEALFPETYEEIEEIEEVEEGEGSEDGEDSEKHGPEKYKYLPKMPVVCAQSFINRNPRMTLASKGQFYSYSSKDTCWKYVTDEGMSGVMLADIELADSVTHKTVNMNQVAGMTKALKLTLQGTTPDRETKVDSWLTGKKGEFITCKNGILDIATGHLYPHSSDWFSFTCLPFNYDPSASCPQFEAFLDSIWSGDVEQQQSLKYWIGYLLISSMEQQKFAVFKGASRAGKGTIVRLIEQLLGTNNYAACSFNTFGTDFGLEPLLGKRAAIFNDAENASGDKRNIATERIKSITGNDSIPINRKGMPIVTQNLPAKIIFVCNNMPNFLNDKNAMTNRMIGFDFKESFFGREDHTLKERLSTEIPGILNWALVGSRAIMAGDKLIQSTSGQKMVEDISISLDSVKCFVRDCIRVTKDSDDRISTKALWIAFKEWCQGSHFHTGTEESFRKRISNALENKAEKYSALEKGYKGIVLDSEGTESTFEVVDDQSDIPF